MYALPTPYECAKEFVTHTNRNLFITGKAGTGKTTFLRKFRAETMKQTAVVAPTGVAAVNATSFRNIHRSLWSSTRFSASPTTILSRY